MAGGPWLTTDRYLCKSVAALRFQGYWGVGMYDPSRYEHAHPFYGFLV